MSNHLSQKEPQSHKASLMCKTQTYNAEETAAGGAPVFNTELSHAGTEYFEAGATFKYGPPMSMADQNKRADQILQQAKQSAAASAGDGAKTGRRLYVMRHAERMDRIFPGWLRLAFTDMGKYRPYDLNMPLQLPIRSGGPQQFHNDAPITEMGHVTSQMLGRGMRLNRVYVTHIFSSPALRCVQTAHGILKALNMQVKVCVEPGLFEWMAWYEVPPTWMSPSEMKTHGYAVDPAYKPVMSVDELMERRTETAIEFCERSQSVIEKILERHATAGPILVIAHGCSLDALTRKLLGRSTDQMSRADMDRMGLHYPYCSVVAMEELANKSWKVLHNPIPPITYLDFSNRINHQFINR